MLHLINYEENLIVLTLSELEVNDSGIYQFEFKHVQTREVTTLELEVFETNNRCDTFVFIAEFERLGGYVYEVFQENKLIETGLCQIK